MAGSGWMLALDASAPRTCVALGRVGDGADGLAFGDEALDGTDRSSERLHARLAAALAEVGIRASELEFVACGRGPGTFTGSRVGVATAKGLALGLELPVVPVSTLASLAASAEVAGEVLALLDARRGQVYGGVFAVRDQVVEQVVARGEERVIELGAWLRELDGVEALAGAYGPGCGAYSEQLPEELRARSQDAPGPTAVGLWRAAVSAQRAGAAVDAGALAVTYLRRSYAEMGVHLPKRPMFKSPFV